MGTSNDTKPMPWSEDDKVHLLRTLQGRPHFEKTLSVSHASQYNGKSQKLVTGVEADSVAGNTKMGTSNDTKPMPWSEDDKVHLLRTLQGRPHFEKTLSASHASQYNGRSQKLTLPTWFVQEYGDNILRSAILRLGCSKNAQTYHVNVGIAYYSPKETLVYFTTGWKAFAIANSLLEGDTLVFVLTSAMSEFEVYIFRSFNKMKTRKRSRSQSPSTGSPSREIESDYSGADYSSPESMATDNERWPFRTPDEMPQVLQRLQEGLYFEKTVTETWASNSGSGNHCGPTLPSWFVEKHGGSIRKTAILRTESSTEAWPITLNIFVISSSSAQVRIGKGWPEFSKHHGLREGDSLIFALSAKSEFKVYVFRGNSEAQNIASPAAGSNIGNPSPRNWSSQMKAAMQFLKCREKQLDADGTGTSSPPSKLRIPIRSRDYLHLHLSFLKTLTATNVQQFGGQLEFPGDFWKAHGHRIQSVVKVQGIYDQSPVRTMACSTSTGKSTRHYLRADWLDFVAEHHLHEGQHLLFTLAADSFLLVREVTSRNC